MSITIKKRRVKKQTSNGTYVTGGGGSSSGSAVSSVFGRTGAVVAVSGDYSADEISLVASGNISATDVQSAIYELDNEKQPLDADLTAIAALSGVYGFLKKTAADTWSIDNTVYTPLNNIAGVANYISKFSGANAVASSILYDDGSHIGVNTSAPAYSLDVTGNFRVTSNSYFESAAIFNSDVTLNQGDLTLGEGDISCQNLTVYGTFTIDTLSLTSLTTAALSLSNSSYTALLGTTWGSDNVGFTVSDGLLHLDGQGGVDIASALYLTSLESATSSYCLYYNSSTKEITYGAVPSVSSATISYLTANLSSAVSMSTSSTWYDAVSLTLTSGTWLVMGFAVLGRNTGAYHWVSARLYNYTSSSNLASSEGTTETSGSHQGTATLTMFAIVTVSTSTIIKLQGRSNIASSAIYATTNEASSTQATKIMAIKLSN
jgi:hypothetical protein